jgi:hypothetical protein
MPARAASSLLVHEEPEVFVIVLFTAATLNTARRKASSTEA